LLRRAVGLSVTFCRLLRIGAGFLVELGRVRICARHENAQLSDGDWPQRCLGSESECYDVGVATVDSFDGNLGLRLVTVD
jgi:hypothetical protein